jgi:glutamate carboxypeptidase
MRELGEAAAGWLVGRLEELEQALAALVEVNSYTDNPEGGRKVGALLREAFQLPGLSAERVPSTRFADHLVFRSQGRAGAEPVALVGHLDRRVRTGSCGAMARCGTSQFL